MTTRIIRRVVAPMSPEPLSLRDMMNRLVENAFVSPEQSFSEWSPQFGVGGPALDVTENNDAYTVKAALPGWKPENVEITFEGGAVTLKGEISEESEQPDENTRWHRREIRRASFQRSVSLSTEVEPDKAKAEFELGILTLTLPKAVVVKPKQIKIVAK